MAVREVRPRTYLNTGAAHIVRIVPPLQGRGWMVKLANFSGVEWWREEFDSEEDAVLWVKQNIGVE
ncbi:MAG: hypothetical protein AB7L13_02325 [Acidimicrobiia bacterium]